MKTRTSSMTRRWINGFLEFALLTKETVESNHLLNEKCF